MSLTGLSWLIAAFAAAAMGYAIQRGSTCTLAAIDEVLSQRRARKLTAMLEASLWVAGGLALAGLIDLMGAMPPGYAVNRWTIVGGALLGLGAWVNSACVFGSIARLGSGEWAYAMSPLGFFAGCLGVAWLFPQGAPAVPAAASPVLAAAALVAPLFVAYALWRLARGLRPQQPGVLTPHAATIVIGVTFVVSWLAAGRWAYTDVLADLAKDMADALTGRGALALALLAGAMWGGWRAGRWRSVAVAPARLARCLAGGALMGLGSVLIPGSNDGLILIGIPLLQPHAWLAFATMCATIAAALLAQRAWSARGA